MSRSKKLPGRNLGLGVEDFTVMRKADEYLDATRPMESIGYRAIGPSAWPNHR